MAGRMFRAGSTVGLCRSSSSVSAIRGPRCRHGVGDADGDHDLLSPPFELAALLPQRLAELRVTGQLEEEGVARAGPRGVRPRLSFRHGAQALDQALGSVVGGVAAGSKSARSRSAIEQRRPAGAFGADLDRVPRRHVRPQDRCLAPRLGAGARPVALTSAARDSSCGSHLACAGRALLRRPEGQPPRVSHLHRHVTAPARPGRQAAACTGLPPPQRSS